MQLPFFSLHPCWFVLELLDLTLWHKCLNAISSVNSQKAKISCGANNTISSQKVSQEPLYVDCTELYTPEEIKSIRKRVGAPDFDMFGPSKYSVNLFKSGALVIKNMTMTNDAIEISEDGSVRHVGSWHNELLAEKGSCIDILEDAKQRLKNKNK